MTLRDFTIESESTTRFRRLSTIERAFELANSGECGSVIEIERRLVSENYENVVEHLWGTFTRDQLRTILAQNVTRARTGTGEMPRSDGSDLLARKAGQSHGSGLDRPQAAACASGKSR